MFRHLHDFVKAAVFYVLALALAVGAARAEVSTAVYMFTPLVAVLLLMFVITRDGYSRAGWARLGLHRAGFPAWGAALLGPLVVMVAGYGALVATGNAELWWAGEIEGVPVSPALAAIFVPITIVKATLTVSLGEELGWRGYLLPRLEALGAWRAALLSGLLHAAWHLPLILLTSLYHAEGDRLIVLPLFLANVTLAGMYFGYLRLRTGSVWPATLAHSTHNVLVAFAPILVRPDSPLTNEYFAGDTGLLLAVGYAALGGWLLYRLVRRPRAVPARLAPATGQV